ncbi:MAG: ion transporter [Marinilabiliaceae bacterium]|nr:ion transporter [Marinilabiliaceae bacterium]
MTIKNKINTIIFGTETKSGRIFDLIWLWIIVLSVLVVMLESIPHIGTKYNQIFNFIEWIVTILFLIEYSLRIYSSENKKQYIFSFWGIIDFISIVPIFSSLIFSNYKYFQIVRILRLLRVYRILKLFRFTRESQVLYNALLASRYKISVFLSTVTALVILLGTLMYVIENGKNNFTSIPQSIYWAVVTITTVGFGDIVPQTILGKIVSSVIMIIGYAIIAVPTGIVTVELTKATNRSEQICPKCSKNNPETAKYCHNCGNKLSVNNH